ncbi:hypothetical protein [Sphingobium herbicidovorans]
MKEIDKWRRDADRLLAAPVERKRSLNSVIGKVDDRFEPIMAARRRGMTWAAIAAALGPDGSLKIEAVESAFRRVCDERGTVPPRRTPASSGKKSAKASVATPPSQSNGTFFGQRWVDGGDD